MNTLQRIGIGAIVLAAGLSGGWWLKDYLDTRNGGQPSGEPPEIATVARIIDGITIELDSGHRVRYLGVRAPNIADKVECFGKEAVAANESTLNKKVRLEEDPVLKKARDGTWVRYVYLVEGEIDSLETEASTAPSAPPSNDQAPMTNDQSSPSLSPTTTPKVSPSPSGSPSGSPQAPPPTARDAPAEDPDDIFINERILEGGFGFPLVSQDMRYGERMLSAARYASATGKGMWSRCEVKDREGQLGTQPIEECTIKGIVTRDLQKIYRTPECPAWQQTIVVESQGGRWFCAEDLAKDEGWVKGSDCPQ